MKKLLFVFDLVIIILSVVIIKIADTDGAVWFWQHDYNDDTPANNVIDKQPEPNYNAPKPSITRAHHKKELNPVDMIHKKYSGTNAIGYIKVYVTYKQIGAWIFDVTITNNAPDAVDFFNIKYLITWYDNNQNQISQEYFTPPVNLKSGQLNSFKITRIPPRSAAVANITIVEALAEPSN